MQLPQAGQVQVPEQVRPWDPQLPQAWVSVVPGVQSPEPVHVSHPPQSQAAEQVRSWLPQLPQAWVSVVPGSQGP